MALNSGRVRRHARPTGRVIGHPIRCSMFTFRFFTGFLSIAVSVFVAVWFLFDYSNSDYVDFGFPLNAYGSKSSSYRRSMLALKSDALKPRLHQVLKQAEDHRNVALACGLLDWGATSIDESVLRRLEKEVKEQIKLMRNVTSEAKESLDNQLKICKLKDALNGVE